jgi:hypothetical protein
MMSPSVAPRGPAAPSISGVPARPPLTNLALAAAPAAPAAASEIGTVDFLTSQAPSLVTRKQTSPYFAR